ncbi:hypothetical protein DM02DRAFT_612113 [Periconia macrospinosa]|uniref:Uncharacterized protein n=1 Tax=Periconia macrospinosa TaxID=97972 RepID=A0A2V1E0J1_9PLEO|nr:hypothetical protein DM02DRAFT_612113 [Periconia macrospinosa]
MRFTSILIAVFTAFAAAAPGAAPEANNALEARQCSAKGVCSTGGAAGCNALKCCSNSKSGTGNGSCCCN